MSSSRVLQKKLVGLWTTQDLVVRFRVTAMTIREWRLKRKLPAIVIHGTGRGTVRYVPHEVLQWATSNHIKMYGEQENATA